MSLPFAVQKLGMGVEVLATRRGRINECLIVRFHRSLHAVGVDAPADQAEPVWAEVCKALTAVEGAPQEGIYAPSIGALDEDVAVLLAEHIVTSDSMASHAADSR
jgi:hypothetical protein